jgi:nucleoside-diphosphate-sugar epimerase
MKVLITGGAGFIGQLLAKALLDDSEGKYEVVLSDIVEPKVPAGAKWPNKAQCIKADLFAETTKVVSEDLDAVFILHGLMSSGAEADFELGKSSVFADRGLY